MEMMNEFHEDSKKSWRNNALEMLALTALFGAPLAGSVFMALDLIHQHRSISYIIIGTLLMGMFIFWALAISLYMLEDVIKNAQLDKRIAAEEARRMGY